jgi:hypothetical protein
MRSLFRPRPLLLLAAATASFAGLTCDDARPLVQLPEQMAAAFCAHQFACCSPFELSTITADRYTAEQDCIPFATISAREQLGAVDGSLVQGRITVDPAALDACVKAYRDSACISGYGNPNIGPLPNVQLMLTYCPDLFVGHVPNNSPCNLPQECQRGSRCAAGPPPSNPYLGIAGASGTASLFPTPGQCIPYQKAGEPCNTSADCDQTAHLACRNFVCGEPLQEGEPCLRDVDPITNQPLSNCDSTHGLFCDLVNSLTCRHYPREGEPCQFLQPPPCDPDPALELSCNQVTGTCKKPGMAGDACGAPAVAPCRPELACHATQSDGIGICGDLPQLGETCTDRCASPNVCVFGICTPVGTKRLGASCAVSTECASLNCMSFFGSSSCQPPLIYPICMGSGVTFGNVSGFGGTKGPGTGGTFITGFAGSGFMTGIGGSRGSAGVSGVGGAIGTGTGGAGPTLGCEVSDIAPQDPLIADFFDTAVPIGGLYTYPSPGPMATIENGTLHVTATTVGRTEWQFWGAGIYFNGNPSGTECIDATVHSGVQFDISGFIEGPGCTAQYSTNDSAHTDNSFDPKGAGGVGVFSPQAQFTVTPTPVTMRMPFAGPSAPTGGNPAISVDRSKLTGVQWQFTTPPDPMSSCNVDITIDNVGFF